MKKDTADRIKRAEEDIEELTRLHGAAIADRNAARAEVVMARAAQFRAEKRLDACLYAMVLLQSQVRQHVDRDLKAAAEKAMGGDTVSIAG